MSVLRTEGDLRAALETLSSDAPAVDDVLPAAGSRGQRRTWPLWLAAAIAVVMIGALAVGLNRGTPEHRPGAIRGSIGQLVGVAWLVDTVDGTSISHPLALHIEPNGRFSQGLGNCASWEGDLTIAPTTLEVTSARLSLGLCPYVPGGPAITQTTPAVQLLRQVFAGTLTWSVNDGRLTIENRSHAVVYRRSPRSPSATRQWTYRGVGISVPANWTRNAQDGCGTPVANTVIYPHTVSSCATVRRPGISSVEFGPYVAGDPEPPHVGMPATTLVDGVRTTEFDARPTLTNTGPQTFVVWIPSRQVSITIIAPNRTAAAGLMEQIYIS